VLGTLGAVLGILTAVAISWGISRGLVRFNLSVFFTWTGLFLILVAAGVLAYGIGDLQEASVIPGWGTHAFSLVEAVPPGSWYGTLLGGIFNFTPEPTWAQVIGWLVYVAVTVPLYLRMLQRRHSVGRAGREAAVSRPAPRLETPPAAPVAPRPPVRTS
jgi:high-affinity iron transporter